MTEITSSSALTADDEAFLAAGRVTFMFALRADGTPTAWPMTSEFLDGELTMSTYRKALKVKIVSRAEHVTLVAVERQGNDLVKAIGFSGPVATREPAPGGPAARAAAGRAAAGALDVPAHILAGVQRAEADGQRVVLAMRGAEATVIFRTGNVRASC